MSENKQDRYVTFKIFSWAIGVIIVVFGWIFISTSSLSSRVNEIYYNNLIVQTQLSQIQTDLVWIKQNLKEHRLSQ